MPRGGRRPEAGAPKGNKNALKHGRYSTREVWAQALDAMLDPKKKRKLINYLKGLTGR